MDQMSEALFERTLVKRAFACKCPRCGQGELYQPGLLNLKLCSVCSSCGFEIGRNDSADGPAVFLIFILGFLLVPLALLTDHLFHWPLFVHGVVWTVLALGITLGLLRPLKSYIIALQLKHRPGDWSS